MNNIEKSNFRTKSSRETRTLSKTSQKNSIKQNKNIANNQQKAAKKLEVVVEVVVSIDIDGHSRAFVCNFRWNSRQIQTYRLAPFSKKDFQRLTNEKKITTKELLMF